MDNRKKRLRKSIRSLLLFFIIALVVSGITAFAIETELNWALSLMKGEEGWIRFWLLKVYNAVKDTNERYPFIAYGYDWLAFAHLVIAVAFIGPLRDPVRNVWIVEFGMIACILIYPLAFIAGSVRQIPFAWQIIDCSFGALGLIPLSFCYRRIKELEKLSNI